MLDVNEVFADFQIIGHKVIKSCFSYPESVDGELPIDYKVDYEVTDINEEYEEASYFGVVTFTVEVEVDSYTFIEVVAEGAFVGNKKAYEFAMFEKLLKANGTATLSQIVRLHLMKITTDVGIGQALVMPMINVYDLIEQKEGSIEE